jgi:hypothetical protein
VSYLADGERMGLEGGKPLCIGRPSDDLRLGHTRAGLGHR